MSGYVDKTERASAGFIVERRTSKRASAAPGARRLPGPTEEEIHRTVVQWLERRRTDGVVVLHPGNGEFRHKSTAARLKAMGVMAGAADLALFYGGRHYWLELKAPGGKQSPEQRHFQLVIERAGGTYAVAHGLDYALDTLRDWGLLQ